MYGLKFNLFNFKTAKYQKKHKVVGYRKKYRKYSWRRNWKDRISDLPDDVLVSILSLLPGTEAVATCVLSRRWEKLWTFTTGTLTFSHPKCFIVKTQSDEDRIKLEFINWVNHALRVHQGPAIQEFCIEFGLDIFSASDIDTWVYFAIKKKVQRLHFDFLRLTDEYRIDEKDYYYFPNLNLLHSRAAGFSNFINSLTELSMSHLNVDESLVQYFLSNCPNLEKLCLESSCSLVNLRVAAPPKLRHLEISYCDDLENIEIASPNLVFLKYIGAAISMTLKNVPKLVEAHMRDEFTRNLINHIPDYLSALSQLEALTLEDMYLGQCRRVRRIPKLLNLKRLVLTVFGRDDQISLLPVIDLLKAAPFLHTFVLELSINRNKEQNIRKVRKAAKYRHQYLKVVELSGFSGPPIDVEIASHLLEAAISLEKITIHTKYGENRLEAKERAKQLKEKLPAGAELVLSFNKLLEHNFNEERPQ